MHKGMRSKDIHKIKMQMMSQIIDKKLFTMPDNMLVITSTILMSTGLFLMKHLLKRLGWKVNEKGIGGAPKLRVIPGGQDYATVFKALTLRDFGVKNVEKVHSC